MSRNIAFPSIINLRGRRYVRRAEFERFKKRLAGLPTKDDDPNEPEVFITMKQCGLELGRTVRSLERWIAEDTAANSTDQAA